MPERPSSKTPFVVEVPLESRGGEIVAGEKIKAVAKDSKGRLSSATVELDKGGNAVARLAFAEHPGVVEVAVAPADFDDEEIHGLQTVTTRVDARRLVANQPLKAAPLLLSSVLRRLWRGWCRKFVVRGRVVCANGNPVPAATVTAFDVDYFWWWTSRQQVGTVTTDVNGEFELRFRWCCGFRPLWWWARRRWLVEPALADHILPVLRALDQPLQQVPRHLPDASVFSRLLDRPVERLPTALDPTELSGLRDRLLAARKLPLIPSLERLRLWPWFPWQPWFDCSPDLIFQVTQRCGADGGVKVIRNEGISDVRWNVATDLTVALQATDDACCLRPTPPIPEGVCGVLGAVCGRPLSDIGGNAGAPATSPDLRGYYSPGGADRPFGGEVSFQGPIGSGVDFYLLQISAEGSGVWSDLPAEAMGDLWRLYLNTSVDAFHWQRFGPIEVGGKHVYESIQHFEASLPSPLVRVSGFETLGSWLSDKGFDDGRYQLRLKGFRREADGSLTDLSPAGGLPECDAPQQVSQVLLTIDNRHVEGASLHPTAPDHPCGSGTVHTCTLEPDTDILDVRVNGVSVKPCDQISASQGGVLQIDFMAHDPDGHLWAYSLFGLGGENASANLLTVPGVTLTPLAVAGYSVTQADDVGPSYAAAVSGIPAASRPTWRGGVIRLTIPDLSQINILPTPDGRRCITQLELVAWKRTIVNCSFDHLHKNTTQYGFLLTL